MEVKRYEPMSKNARMILVPSGDWVSYADYQRLLEHFDRLKRSEIAKYETDRVRRMGQIEALEKKLTEVDTML